MELSVSVLQVTLFIINSKLTNAWCLSEDLMYTCKLSQDLVRLSQMQEGRLCKSASACCWKSSFFLRQPVWPPHLDCSVGLSPSNRLGSASLEVPALAELLLWCTPGHCTCTSLQWLALVSPIASNSWDPSTQRSQETNLFQNWGAFFVCLGVCFVFKKAWSIWCESPFSWFLGALPSSSYLSDSLEVNVRWPTSLVRGLLVTIATKPQLKSCVLNLQD